MFLKKWKQEIINDLTKNVDEEVRDISAKAMADMMERITRYDGEVLNDRYYGSWDISKIRNAFQSAVEKKINIYTEGLDNKIDMKLKNLINSEEFIDTIVARILKKQLTK